jgi:carboxymethylenebutenolidase
MAQVTGDDILADIDGAIAFLVDAGVEPPNIGIVGFCMGGSIALIAAAERELGAAVTYYGGGVTTGRFGFPPLVDLAPRLRAPWLGLFGDRDHSIPVDDVEQLRAAAAQSSSVTEVVRYGDAGHGFHCGQRGDYHAASAHDAWRRTQEWFSTHLGVVTPTG